ncbi:hypothetical protein HDU67_002530 [Dinochytrium kinnereticum]|nr:hypothetical protein HDU67_002530 [Dinochytrium kinnereticum]
MADDDLGVGLNKVDHVAGYFEHSEQNDSVVSVAFSSDGSYAASGSLDGTIYVANVQTKEITNHLDGPTEVTWLQWHHRGNILLCGSADGTVWMWQIPSGKCLNVFSGHSGGVSAGKFTSDGKSIITCGEDGNLILWDPKTANVKLRLSPDDSRFHSVPISALGISPTSNIVMTGAEDGTVVLSNLDAGKDVFADIRER